MAVQYMTHMTANGRHIHTETLGAGLTSDPLMLPSVYGRMRSDDRISVVCIPAVGATGKIQYTLSSVANVEAGSAIWIDWPSGNVTAATGYAINGPVTALRCINVAGAFSVAWGVLK